MQYKVKIRDQKILLVDDLDYNRQLLRHNLTALFSTHSLKHKAFSYFQAHNAASALQAFSLQLPDLVFLDIELPDGSGIELLKRFKQQKPDCFVVMVSGVSTLDNVKASIAAGAASFIVKPFSADKILAVLKQFDRYFDKVLKTSPE
ncbi:MAG: response regulator [Gammaproteobacteria bacterium]|nr:response regulator [Gammaproteobacteria bacterium]MBU2058861.1 response regulator [Gammaproteobacteria bacterium]MBU2177076.1 response regulator [Gammaproteobacteria bacterium]MBU2247062.1 response regulator [Gammaproteobacteria bacterium]MBU2345340.1 response regulator [Gammaproteobacteria bacterium]